MSNQQDNAPQPAQTPPQPPRPHPPLPQHVLASQTAPRVESYPDLAGTRDVFWQNVAREMLLAFPSLAAARPELTDGRFALLTHAGERIPVASVAPLFACSITAPQAFDLCMAVQCTVFNIGTPHGEVFTIPLREIRAIHALSGELLNALENAARTGASGASSQNGEPFGFAAFTSLAQKSGAAGDTPQKPAE